MDDKLISIFKLALIPEEHWQYCFVDDVGNIYPPVFDNNGTLLMSGSEAKAWMETQSNIETKPTIEQRTTALESAVLTMLGGGLDV